MLCRGAARHIRIARRMFIMHLGRDMQYRASFLWSLGAVMLELGAVVVFFHLVYAPDPLLTQHWPWGKMLLLLGTVHLINGTHRFLFGGLRRLGDLIETGDLDLMLTRPAHPLVVLSISRPDLASLLSLVGAVPLLYLGAIQSEVVAGLNVLLFVLYLPVGLLIRFYLSACIMLLSFWLIRVHALYYTVEELSSLMRYPVVVFRGVGAIILKYMIPMVLIANVPVLALSGQLSPLLAIYPFAFALALHMMTACLWRRGVVVYSSAGG